MSRRPSRPAIGSWPGGFVVRRIKREDIEALDIDLPEKWDCADLVGYALERDGAVAATGRVTVDRYGRVWGWFNRMGNVPPATMHRCALEMLAMLREVGEPALYIFCEQGVPGAEKWAKRLGFVKDNDVIHPWGPVYRCDLSE